MIGDHSDDYVPRGDSIATDLSEPVYGKPKTDGIDYLQDVNVAIRDIINLFRTTLECLEQKLSNVSSSTKGNLETESSIKEMDRVFSAESGNCGDTVTNGLSKAAYNFLNKLRFLVEHTEQRINVSPTEQQELDRKLRRAVRSSGKTEMDIKALKDSLSLQRIEHERSVAKLKDELNDCLESSHQKAKEIENDVNRIVNESEMKMVNFYKEFIARKELLRSEIKFLESRLSDLRNTHILVEKNLRDKRCKVENRLLDSLAKYDRDIGGRHEEMENLAKNFELLNSQRKMLEEDVMVNLRMVHDQLQKEKAEALQKILNERVENFVRNRAARVIQSAWRAYWERHCAKKKKKSRKK